MVAISTDIACSCNCSSKQVVAIFTCNISFQGVNCEKPRIVSLGLHNSQLPEKATLVHYLSHVHIIILLCGSTLMRQYKACVEVNLHHQAMSV